MDNNKMSDFDFKSWILGHNNKDYEVIHDSDNLIILKTDYAQAQITFTAIEESIIVEFNIVSFKDNASKFYLHFELNDEDHAKQLYNEMVGTLIDLKKEKSLRVLLSCSAGLTTAMFADNLNSMAEVLGLDYTFDAVSYMSIYEEAENYDVIMIAPQIGYMYKRLKESLSDKLVLQIPTQMFASYDALSTIKFLQGEIEEYIENNNIENEHDYHCAEYDNRILSIAIITNKAQARIYYQLHDKGDIIDSNMIIKPSMDIYDLYDIIDTILLKYGYIDMIGIASPGIIKDGKQLREPSEGRIIDIEKEFEDKYHIKVVAYNSANATAVGFQLEHPEYKNILYHTQPIGYGNGGQGIIIDGKVLTGKNGMAGEVRYFLYRMQLSDEVHKLCWSEHGSLELVTKALLPTIALVGPEAVALHSPMTPDMKEVKDALSSFIPDEYLPEFYYIKDPYALCLNGVTKMCVDYIEEHNEEE